MNLQKLILRSFLHYIGANLTAAAGLAIATAVITGALITGDSLSHSLEKAVSMRLGNITHSVTAGERLFTMKLGERFAAESGLPVSRALVAQGIAVTGGGRERLNNVQVLGVDEYFSDITGTVMDHSDTGPGEVVISDNMARRLELETGDYFQLRMKKTGIIPMNTPLVSGADQSVSRRVMVAAIAKDEDLGRFNLGISQTAPFNVFVNINWLNAVMGLEEMANLLLISDPGSDIDDLKRHLDSSWEPADANLEIRQLPGRDILEIRSERVFIEEHVTSQLSDLFPDSRKFLTYFVNSIEKEGNSTPYSFVTAGHRFPIEPGETIISRWLADDLSAERGDTLHLRYWQTGPRRELTEKEISLVVRDIAEMNEIIRDSILMPYLPGLSDAGNCRDWEAGIPIELDRIRERDEKYWDDYKGTPKAYISLEQGKQLWSNRFGNLTSLWLPAEITGENEAAGLVRNAVDPASMGFMINELKERGLQSAAGGVDFGMLFGGLGFFVMMAGVLLFFLLLLFNMERRSGQVRLFSSMGFPLKLIRRIYLGEGMLVAIMGTLFGLALSVLYAKAVHLALTGVWHDIVRTDMLELSIQPSSMLAGAVTGLIIALLVTLFSLNSYILKKPVSPDRKMENEKKAGNGRKVRFPGRKTGTGIIVAALLVLAGILVLIRQILTGAGTEPAGFFIAGGLLIPAFLLTADILLERIANTGYRDMTMALLSVKNLARNRVRSLSVIIMMSLGIFVVIATGFHRNDAYRDEGKPEGGTGGFLFVAESTVPVLFDLNSTEARLDLNIPGTTEFVQFMTTYADDASCLNLNEVSNPRILSVNPASLQGRFSFARGSRWLDSEDPWNSLASEIGGDGPVIIPAIADQEVIQWGLGKRVGDTLTYVNERGREIRLLLVGGLANSVFQGNVIISEDLFLKHFPSVSGSNFFLIDAPKEDREELIEELEFIFRDHGWEMTTTVERLNEFNSVQNTYLGIFLMLGALGILIGVAGLAVVMARTILERRSEIGLFASLGYRRSQIESIIFREYALLLLAGLAAGLPPAIIASLPSILNGSQQANASFLILLVLVIILNGMIWIAVTSRIMTIRSGITPVLRND